MMEIFGFFGSLLGWVLWAALYLVNNFGIAIIIFTIVIKCILFPFSVKQQKSMANNARYQKKQAELREKYGTNKEKMNEEMQKLYAQEGFNPMGGCATSIVPMVLMLGIFYAVAYPFTNTLHLNATAINDAINYISTIPGLDAGANTMYSQIELARIFPSIADSTAITDLFSKTDIANMLNFSNSFTLFGVDLLVTPSTYGFFSPYIIVPIACFASSVGAQFIMMKMNGTGNQMQGCMKFAMYLLPLFSAYIAYTVPTAVGFYWIMSSLISLVQGIITGKMYSPAAVIANSEARHIALMEVNEAKVPKVYAPKSITKAFENKTSKKKKK